MAKAHKLKPLEVKNLTKPGYHLDGAGLILKVTAQGSKSWIYRYMLHGADRWMGLGSYPEVSLAEARELAAENRKKIRAGMDPLGEKRAVAATSRADRAKAVTFDWCAEKFIEAYSPSWKNAKHADQWRNTLKTYASPVIGALDVARIETGHIMKILEPIWHTKAETASRVRGRIESVLDWATVKKFRTGENPARWKGHIDKLLPARNKKATVEHHPALPFAQMSEFMTELRTRTGTAARAVEFGILTGARSSEIRGMVWDELNEGEDVWIIPAARMKVKKEHRVPLSAEALKIIAGMKKIKNGDLVFPGMKIKDDKPTPLSDMSLTAVLKRMDEDKTKSGLPGWRDGKTGEVITMHGFRSSFRDWVAESTDYPHEMGEIALAHTVASAVALAYLRGDMMRKRRALMQDWANFSFSKTEIKQQ